MKEKIPLGRKPDNDKENNEKIDRIIEHPSCRPVGNPDDGPDDRNNPRPPEPPRPSQPQQPRSTDPRKEFERSFMSPFGSDDDLNSFFGRSLFRSNEEFMLDFDRGLSELHERMDSMFRGGMEGNQELPGEGGPFVYGFSMHSGPDGVPHYKEYSNMPTEMREAFREQRELPSPSSCTDGSCDTGVGCGSNSSPNPRQNPARQFIERHTGNIVRKPYTDIMDCGDHISITMELPGIDKKYIALELEGSELEVSVDTPERKYYNKIPLPVEVEVEPESIEANFKNGVLNINIKHKEQNKKKESNKIKIN